MTAMFASMSAVLALLALTAASPAAGALLKCANDRGGVVYQDVACPPGRELRDLEAHPATLSVVPGTPVPATLNTAKPRASNASSSRPVSTRAIARRGRTGNAAERRFIHAGMSEAEVIMRIGRPDVHAKGHGKGAGRQWSYLPTAGDEQMLTTVTFAGGKVVDVERHMAR
jgi:uncharacterized protein DUF4124